MFAGVSCGSGGEASVVAVEKGVNARAEAKAPAEVHAGSFTPTQQGPNLTYPSHFIVLSPSPTGIRKFFETFPYSTVTFSFMAVRL